MTKSGKKLIEIHFEIDLIYSNTNIAMRGQRFSRSDRLPNRRTIDARLPSARAGNSKRKYIGWSYSDRCGSLAILAARWWYSRPWVQSRGNSGTSAEVRLPLQPRRWPFLNGEKKREEADFMPVSRRYCCGATVCTPRYAFHERWIACHRSLIETSLPGVMHWPWKRLWT